MPMPRATAIRRVSAGGDCATQRNLGAAGREQALAAGRWLRSQGVVRAQVFSSPWCRCLETARLLAGPLDRAPILVTHQGVITAYAGGGVASSEMVLVRVDRQGWPQDTVRYAPPPLS